MKLGLGLYRDILTAENVRFAKQCGATHIVAHIPGNFTKGKKIITSDLAGAGFGYSDGDDPIWSYEGLRDLKAMVNSEGMELEALENFAPAHWYDVLLDGPKKKQQMEHLKQIIRDVGRVGIPIMGYCFTVAGTWGRTEAPRARGKSMSVGFDNPCSHRSRRAWSGTWSMMLISLMRTTPRVSSRQSRRRRSGSALATLWAK